MEEQVPKCVYCSNSLPTKGFYCPSCAKQIRCKNCREYIEKDANACIYCGTAVGAQGQTSEAGNGQSVSGSQPVMNEIEYHETKSSRSARARFTDTVGSSVSNALVGFIGKGFKTNAIPSKFEKGPLIEDGSAEVIVDTDIESKSGFVGTEVQLLNIATSQPVGDLATVQKILRFEPEKTTILETRLKAQNKIDYVRRLILLFLYGHHLMDKSIVPRNDLTKLLDKAALNDGNTRSWINNNSQMTVDHGENTLEINTPGIEMAKQYLQEIGDIEVKDAWLITTAPKKRKKKKQDNNNSDEQ